MALWATHLTLKPSPKNQNKKNKIQTITHNKRKPKTTEIRTRTLKLDCETTSRRSNEKAKTRKPTKQKAKIRKTGLAKQEEKDLQNLQENSVFQTSPDNFSNKTIFGHKKHQCAQLVFLFCSVKPDYCRKNSGFRVFCFVLLKLCTQQCAPFLSN